MTTCKQCRSYAINLNMAGRDASEPELCDVCYWRGVVAAKDAELAGYVEANRHMKGELDDALEDARKYAEAQRDVARLRDRLDSALSQSSLFGDALHAIANRCEGMASRIARAALAQVAESRE